MSLITLSLLSLGRAQTPIKRDQCHVLMFQASVQALPSILWAGSWCSISSSLSFIFYFVFATHQLQYDSVCINSDLALDPVFHNSFQYIICFLRADHTSTHMPTPALQITDFKW